MVIAEVEGGAVAIGPIVGILPLAMAGQAEGPADLARVSGIELRHQGGDRDNLPNQKARRGLEEEEAAEAPAGEEENAEGGVTRISFFA